MAAMEPDFCALAVSLKGRDAGGLFLAFGKTERAVLLADGKIRKLNSPKRKNLRHVRLLKGRMFETVLGDLGDRPTDAQLRRALARYKAGTENV
jgi:hypothetical protein